MDGSFQEGFDTPKRAPSAGADFLRLQDGEKAVIRILRAPVHYYDHWSNEDKRSTICTMEVKGSCPICDDPGAPADTRRRRFRFIAPVFLHAFSANGQKYDSIGEVRIFEQGARALEALNPQIAALTEEGQKWEDTDFTLSRAGAGTDTKYAFVARRKATPVPEDAELPDIRAFLMGKVEAALAPAGKSLAAVAPGDGPDFGDPFADQ